MAKRKDPWTSLAFDSWSLGLEASTVIGLRMMKLAAGGEAAQAETQLMISEKVATGFTLPMLAMTGQLGASGPAIASGSLAHLRKKVRANRRRLSKGEGGSAVKPPPPTQALPAPPSHRSVPPAPRRRRGAPGR